MTSARPGLPDEIHNGFRDFARNCDLPEAEARMLVNAAAAAIEDRYAVAFREFDVTWWPTGGRHMMPYRPFARALSGNIKPVNDFAAEIEIDCHGDPEPVRYRTGARPIGDTEKLAIWKVAAHLDEGETIDWISIDAILAALKISPEVAFYAGAGGFH